MTPENFVYWLNGFIELGRVGIIDTQQVQVIRDHIALVLNKKTPSLVSFGNSCVTTTGIPVSPLGAAPTTKASPWFPETTTKFC